MQEPSSRPSRPLPPLPEPLRSAPRPSPVVEVQRTAAGELVADLKARGVDTVFCIPGGTIAPVLDALLDGGIESVVCQHETMAVYAASAHAEITGKPGVIVVTSGPGVLNAVTGIAAAFHGEVPLLILCGEVAQRASGKGALQDGGPVGLDLAQAMRPFTKRTESLQYATAVGPMVDRAFAAALSVPQGPVLLRLPVDVAGSPGTRGKTVVTEPTSAPSPHEATCAEVARLLAKAKRPLIWAGIGARRGKAGASLRMLAEASGCRVITDVEAKGLFPETHPLSAGVFGVGGRGPAAALLAQGVDLLLTVGTRLDDTTTNNFSPLVQRAEKLVQLDHDARRLGRSYGAAISMHCDLSAALDSIAAKLPVRQRTDEVLPQLPTTAKVTPLGRAPHDPRAVARELARALGPDAVWTCDIGNHMLFTASELALERPDSFYVSIGLGGMGSGIGYAIGATLAHGDARPVVSVSGDGGMLMVGNELATCAKYRIPTLFVVFNDGHLNMVQHGLTNVFGRSMSCVTPKVDFCAYARSLGVEAHRVDGPADLALLKSWHREAPLLLEVPVDPTCKAANPREDTINFPAPKSGAAIPPPRASA